MSNVGVSANRLEILQIANAVASEKQIDKSIVLEAMEEAIQKAARSRYGQEHDIRVEIDANSGETKSNTPRACGAADGRCSCAPRGSS